MTAPSAVSLAEAIPLVAAIASRLADDAGIRLLLIKGQPATDLGARADRPSVDVDVWVDPTRHAAYVRLLVEQGWVAVGGPPAGVGWGHATTVSHSVWPCTIDIHHSFPGFLADDDKVFNEIWRRRQVATLARSNMYVPNRVAATAVSALHAARSSVLPETHDDWAATLLAAVSLDETERSDLIALAQASGATDTLTALFDAASIPSTASEEHADALADWRLRTSLQGAPSAWWLMGLRQTPWRSRPAVVACALRPSPSDYANSQSTSGTLRGAWKASHYRWRRGLRAMPGAVARLRGRRVPTGRKIAVSR